MFEVLLIVVALAVGLFVGTESPTSVNQAISTIKTAEQKAAAVLAAITAHKAS